jgi:hypothetical protein
VVIIVPLTRKSQRMDKPHATIDRLKDSVIYHPPLPLMQR